MCEINSFFFCVYPFKFDKWMAYLNWIPTYICCRPIISFDPGSSLLTQNPYSVRLLSLVFPYDLRLTYLPSLEYGLMVGNRLLSYIREMLFSLSKCGIVRKKMSLLSREDLCESDFESVTGIMGRFTWNHK